jgi:small-conductance mechanosensitive channel
MADKNFEWSSIKSEFWQIVFAIVLMSGISIILGKSDIWTAFFQSVFYNKLQSNVLSALFEIFLIYIFFKLAYFVLISIVFLRVAPFFAPKEQVQKVSRFIRFVWWAIFVLTIIAITFGDDVDALLTSVGLVGLGLTVALQKPIMNFVGWLTIIFKNVYSEGDRIKIGKARGDVRKINMMNTVIDGLLDTADQPSHKVFIVPNEFVLTGEVENYTQNSNYIRMELKIGLTLESNHKKAMALFDKAVRKVITRNITRYVKRKEADQIEIQRLLEQIVSSRAEKKKLQEKEQALEKEIKQLQELSDEFSPRIRLEIIDSQLVIVAFYLTLYDEINLTRSNINLEFLDLISSEPDIKIAYPHRQIVFGDSSKEQKKKLEAELKVLLNGADSQKSNNDVEIDEKQKSPKSKPQK